MTQRPIHLLLVQTHDKMFSITSLHPAQLKHGLESLNTVFRVSWRESDLLFYGTPGSH